MDEEQEPPARPGPPPPDLVKSSPPIPPPSIPAPNLASPAPVTGPPPMSAPELPPSMKAQMTRDEVEEEEETDGMPTLNNRLIAAVIDCVVALGLQIAVSILMPNALDKLAWLVATAYLVTRDSLPFLGGQSVGKKAMKLKAVTLEGKSLAGNWEPALIRNGILIIPFFALLELYLLFTREEKPERGRRLGDEWAKTKVIVARDPVVE